MAEWVLVWAPTSIVRSAALCSNGRETFWAEGSGRLPIVPTHWMPLPPSPAAQAFGESVNTAKEG